MSSANPKGVRHGIPQAARIRDGTHLGEHHRVVDVFGPRGIATRVGPCHGVQFLGEVLRNGDHRDFEMIQPCKRKERQLDGHQFNRPRIGDEIDIEPERGELPAPKPAGNTEAKTAFDFSLNGPGWAYFKFEPFIEALFNGSIEESQQLFVRTPPIGIDVSSTPDVGAEPPKKGDAALDRPAVIIDRKEASDKSAKRNVLPKPVVRRP